MTATWALVFMLCGRGPCTVEYVENYNSRAECVKHMPVQTGLFNSQRAVCAPISKD